MYNVYVLYLIHLYLTQLNSLLVRKNRATSQAALSITTKVKLIIFFLFIFAIKTQSIHDLLGNFHEADCVVLFYR